MRLVIIIMRQLLVAWLAGWTEEEVVMRRQEERGEE